MDHWSYVKRAHIPMKPWLGTGRSLRWTCECVWCFKLYSRNIFVYQIDGFQQKVLLPSGTTKLSFIELFDMFRFTDDNLLLLGLPFQSHVKSLCFIRIVLKIKTLIYRNKTLLYLATCFIDLIRSWTRLATNEQVWFRPTWDAFSRSAKDSAVL